MSEYKIQVNPTFGDWMFNINGDTAEELETHITELAKRAPQLFEGLGNVKQAALAAGVFSSNEGKKTPAAAAEDGPPAEVRCEHGPMKDLAGVRNAKGDLYKYRYYCAAERNDPTKCKNGKVEQ